MDVFVHSFLPGVYPGPGINSLSQSIGDIQTLFNKSEDNLTSIILNRGPFPDNPY